MLHPIRVLTRCFAPGAALAAVLLAGVPASAFSVVTPDGTSQGAPAASASTPYATTTPEFDIEEQMRQFRKDGSNLGSAGAAIREFDTPLGKAKIEVGTHRDFGMFSSPFGFGGFNSYSDFQNRRHMDRMLAPPGLQHQYDH